MLPRSFEYVRREWVADLDSFDHDDFIQAQRQLHTFSRPFASSIPFDPSLYVEPSLVSLKRSMENPLDLALAAICSAAGVPNSHEVNAELSDAYASLARGIDRYVLSHILHVCLLKHSVLAKICLFRNGQ